jgi:small subunit ribosomal protein S18
MSEDTKKRRFNNSNNAGSGGGLRKRRGRPCFFCENKKDKVDYKDVDLLRRFQADRGKIAPRRQSGCCAKHQRKVAEAIKRARQIGLLPFVVE